NGGTLLLGGDERLLNSGVLTQNGGAFNLGGFNQTTGAVTLNAGTIVNGTLTGASYGVVSGDISANLAGSGVLTKTGTGLVTLSGLNSYSGGTVVNNGTLALGVDNTLLASGAVSVTGGELSLGTTSQTVGALSLTGGLISGGTLTGTSYVVGAGTIGTVLGGAFVTLTKNNSGTVLLSGVNTYGGGTVINAGTLRLGGAERLSSTGVVTVSGGTLDLAGFEQTTGLVQLTGGSITGGTLFSSSVVASAGAITSVLGGYASLLVLPGSGAVRLLSQNQYSGSTSVNGGSLILAVPYALPVGTSLSLNSGALNLGGFNQAVGFFTGSEGVLSQGTLSADAFTLAVSAAHSLTISANLTGSAAALLKSGVGLVTLSGANTYRGGTTLSAGTLALASNNTLLSSGSVAIQGGILDLGATSQQIGTLTLSGGSLTGSAVSGGILTATGFDVSNGTVDAILAGGTSVLTKTGGAKVSLNRQNTYGGGTVLEAGTLELGVDAALSASGAVTVNNGLLSLGTTSQTVGAVTLKGGVLSGGTLTGSAYAVESGTLATVLAGSAALTKSNAGEVTVSVASTYGGGTTVSAGTLTLAVNNALFAGGSLTLAGGSISLGTTSQTVGPLTVRGGLLAGGTLTGAAYNLQAGAITSVLSGIAALTKTGAGLVTLNSVNNYSGGTTVQAGTLQLAIDGALLASGTVTVGGGELALGMTSQTVGVLNLSGGLISGGTLTGTAYALEAGSVSGVLAGGAALVKSGSGTVVLSGSNSYTGGTVVTDGRLLLLGNNRLNTTSALVMNGGVLDLGLGITGLSDLQLNGGLVESGSLIVSSLLAVNAGSISAQLGGGAGLIKDTNGTVTLSGLASYTGGTTVRLGTLALIGTDVLAAAGSLHLNGGVLDLGAVSQAAGAVTLNGGLVRNGTLSSATGFTLESGMIGALLAGGGSVAKNTAGTVALTLSNVFASAGTLTVNLGELDLGGLLSNAGQVVVNGGTVSNGTLQSATGFSLTGGLISALLSGSGGLTKSGADTATLRGLNSYSGGTTIGAGTLLLGAANVLSATGTVTITGGILDLGGFSTSSGTLVLSGGLMRNGELSATSFDLRNGIIDGVLSGAGAVTKTTADTVLLNGTVGTSGDLVVTEGTLLLGASNRINDSTRVRLGLNGTLDLGGFFEKVSRLRLDGGVITGGTIEASIYEISSGNVSTLLSGAGALEKVSDGSASGGVSTLSIANTYTGGTTVSAGTLKLAGDNRLNIAGSLMVVGGSFDLDGFSQTVTTGSLISGVLHGGTLVATEAFILQSGVASTLLAGSASLSKTTAGTVTLLGANSYTGGTTISGGSLQLTLTGGIGTGGALLVAGGTLRLGGVEQFAGVVTLSSGVIEQGSLSGSGFVLQDGRVDAVLSGTAALTKELSGTVSLGAVSNFVGAVTVSAGTLALGVDGALGVGNALTVGGGVLSLGTTAQTVGSLVLSGGSITGGVVTATDYAIQNGYVSSVLAGSASLTKSTLGTATLVGLNTYAGNTTVNGGTLVLGGSQVLARNGAVVVNAGVLDLGGAYSNAIGQLVLNDGSITGGVGASATLSAGSFTVRNGIISAVLAGTGALTKDSNGSADGGTVVLSGQNTYSGDTTVNAGRLTLGGNQVLSSQAALVVNNGTLDLGGEYSNNVFSLTLNNGAIERGTISAGSFNVLNGSISAILSGSGALTKSGAGTVVLSGQNTYTGETIVTGGSLVLGGNQVLSSTAPLTVRGGTLDLGGSYSNSVALLTLDGGNIVSGSLLAGAMSIFSGTVSAVLAGTGALSKAGAGEFVLNSASTYTGGTTLSAGTLRLGASERLADAGSLVVNGGALEMAGFRETVASLSLTSGELRNGTLTAGGFELKAGTVNVSLAGIGAVLNKTTSGTVTLNVAATYSGGTNITDGVLALGNDGVLASSGSVRISGGELALGVTSQTSGVLTLSNGILSGGTLSATSFTLEAGVVSTQLAGTGVLTKNTSGTVLLTAASTYSGGTVLNDGTLRLGGSDRLLSTGAVTLNGGVLDLAGNTQTAGLVTISGGLIVNGSLFGTGYAVGAGSLSTTLGGNASLVKDTGGTVLLTGTNTYSGGTVVKAGTLLLGADERLLATGSIAVTGGVLNLGGNTQTTAAIVLTGGTITNGRLNGGAFDVQAGDVSAELAGSGMLTKSSAGTVTLTGANTYFGGTVLQNGTLNLGVNDTLLASGSVTLNGGELALGVTSQTVGLVTLKGGVISGGTLNAAQFFAESGVLGAVLSGSGSFTKSTDGVVVLNAVNGYTGETLVNGGSLVLGASERLLAGGSLTLNAGVLDLAGNSQTLANFSLLGGTVTAGSLSAGGFVVQNGSVNAVLGGTAALVKDGAGTVALNAANTYTGGTVLREGTLRLGVDQALVSTGSLTVNAGVLALGTTVQSVEAVKVSGGVLSGGSLFATSFVVEAGTIGTVLLGSSTLTKNGTGTVLLNEANKYTGGTVVNAGTLQLGASERLVASGSLMAGGGVLNLGGYSQTTAVLTLAGGTILNGTLTSSHYAVEAGNVSAMLDGAGALSKTTTGAATLSASNTYSGGTTVGDGVLNLGVNNALLATGSVTLTGGELALGTTTQNVGVLTLAGGALTGGTLTGTRYIAQAGSVSAALGGAGVSFTKDTQGTVLLTGANTFTGKTLVEAGVLQLNGAQQTISSGTVELRGGVIEILAGGQINSNAALLFTGGTFLFGPAVTGQVETVGTMRISGGSVTTGANSIIGTGSTVRLENGQTTISSGGLLQDQHIVLSGGVNVIEGGGSLVLTATQNGATAGGLELVGGSSALLTIQGGSTPGTFTIGNNVTVDASNGAALLASTGSGSTAGRIDLGSGVRSITVTGGTSGGGLTLQASVLNGGMAKLGDGVLTLAGATALDKGLSLTGGTLQLAHSGALAKAGTGQLTFDGGLLQFTPGITSDVSDVFAPIAAGKVARIDTNGQPVTFATGLSGAGSFVKTGAGALTLSGTSTYTGGTTISNGSLGLSVNNALAAAGS
ncbi:MAG: hypothetical protein EBS01_01420, partial [Verrucomicrobia bacterium]|nr:hypothetical protein [Verrucomicrobiota bacterium]